MSRKASFEVTYDYKPGDVVGDYGVVLISSPEYPITGSTRCQFSCTVDGCTNTINTTVASILAGVRFCQSHIKGHLYGGGKIAKYDALELPNEINGCKFLGFSSDDRKSSAYGRFECATPGCHNTFDRLIDNVLTGHIICEQCMGNITADRNRNSAPEYHPGDIVGENKLELVRLTGNKVLTGKHSARCAIFKCPYDCPDCKTNRMFETYLQYAVTGKTKSCHEKAHKISAFEREAKIHGDTDISGQRFDHLTAIKPLSYPMRHKTQWLCVCDCGNEKITSAHTLLAGHVHACGDPSCQYSVKSYGEVKIAMSLIKLNIPYIPQETFFQSDIYEKSINPKTGSRMPFDFYLPTFGVCIEYDGEQHFTEGWWTTLDFGTRCEYDEIKNDFCMRNGLKLIRIPYIDKNLISPTYMFDILLMNNCHNATCYIPDDYIPWYKRRLPGCVDSSATIVNEISQASIAKTYDLKSLLSKYHVGAVVGAGFIILDRIIDADDNKYKYLLQCPYECQNCNTNHQLIINYIYSLSKQYIPKCYEGLVHRPRRKHLHKGDKIGNNQFVLLRKYPKCEYAVFECPYKCDECPSNSIIILRKGFAREMKKRPMCYIDIMHGRAPRNYAKKNAHRLPTDDYRKDIEE